ncbi:MAG TPA: hypothetical protein DEF72_01530 [Gammaproteobacteria bacterium]|nr:hypothetical protein [Gammaproteobacteria bacterium]
MGLFDWVQSGDSDAAQRSTAKKIFEQTVAAEGDSREKRALRVRQAVRIRVVMDKIFVAGTKAWAGYEESRMIAIAGGDDVPPSPAATEETCYQTVNTVNGQTMAYIPLEFATSVYELGVRYQKGEVDGMLAVNSCQDIANTLGDLLKLDLYAVQPILPLNFLLEDRGEIDEDVD